MIEKIATTLFYASITVVGVHGYTTIMGHGLSHIPEIVELVTSSTKFYEIILLIIAFFVLKKYSDKIKGGVSQVAHSLGECIEGGSSSLSSLMDELEHMNEDNEYQQKVLECIFSGDEH